MNKQDLHNRIDRISNEFMRHLKKLIESMKIDDSTDMNITNHIQIQKSNLMFASSMACLETAKQYLILIQAMKNDVLLADVTQIKKEIDLNQKERNEQKFEEKKLMLKNLDELTDLKSKMDDFIQRAVNN